MDEGSFRIFCWDFHFSKIKLFRQKFSSIFFCPFRLCVAQLEVIFFNTDLTTKSFGIKFRPSVILLYLLLLLSFRGHFPVLADVFGNGEDINFMISRWTRLTTSDTLPLSPPPLLHVRMLCAMFVISVNFIFISVICHISPWDNLNSPYTLVSCLCLLLQTCLEFFSTQNTIPIGSWYLPRNFLWRYYFIVFFSTV